MYHPPLPFCIQSNTRETCEVGGGWGRCITCCLLSESSPCAANARNRTLLQSAPNDNRPTPPVTFHRLYPLSCLAKFLERSALRPSRLGLLASSAVDGNETCSLSLLGFGSVNCLTTAVSRESRCQVLYISSLQRLPLLCVCW